MENLRVLTLSLHGNPHSFILSLGPGLDSENPIACTRLESLPLHINERLYIESLTRVAAARALNGAPLKSIRIVGGRGCVPRVGLMGLREYVSHVEIVLVSETKRAEEVYSPW